MTTEYIGVGIAGLFALAYGLRTLMRGTMRGRVAHGTARIILGAAVLVQAVALTVGRIEIVAGPWIWWAIAIAYGSIATEGIQIARALRSRRLTEAERLRHHISRSDVNAK